MVKTYRITETFDMTIDTDLRTIAFTNINSNRWWQGIRDSFSVGEGKTISLRAQSTPEFRENSAAEAILFLPGNNIDRDSDIIAYAMFVENEILEGIRQWANRYGKRIEEVSPAAIILQQNVVQMRRFIEGDIQWASWNNQAQNVLRQQLSHITENKEEIIIKVSSQYTRGQCFWWPRQSMVCIITGGYGPNTRTVWKPIETVENADHIARYERILQGRIRVSTCAQCGMNIRVTQNPEREVHVVGERIFCEVCVRNFTSNTELYPCDNVNCQGSHMPTFRSRNTQNVRVTGTRQFLHFCTEACKKEAGFVSCAHRSCSIPKPVDATDWIKVDGNWFCCEEHAIAAGYRKCNSCGDWHSEDIAIGDQYFCADSCAEEGGYKRCPQCGVWHIEEEVQYCDECDIHYCPSCENAHENSHIERVWQVRVREPRKDMSDFIPGAPSFGIELEIGSLPKGPVNEIIPRNWGIHQDGSTMSGYEFVTPPFQMDSWAEIKKTLNMLEAECAITQKEGTHLHIGNWVDELHAIRFYIMAIHIQHTLKQIIAPSRGANAYCMFRPEMKLKLIYAYTNGKKLWVMDEYERYRAINSCAYTEHGTVEIRCHQGTVNDMKLAKWIELWQTLYLYTIQGNVLPNNCCTFHMLKSLGIAHEYWEARSQVLHPKAWRKEGGNKHFNCGGTGEYSTTAYDNVQLRFYQSPVNFYINKHKFVQFDKTEEIEEFIIDIEQENKMKGWPE